MHTITDITHQRVGLDDGSFAYHMYREHKLSLYESKSQRQQSNRVDTNRYYQKTHYVVSGIEPMNVGIAIRYKTDNDYEKIIINQQRPE